MGGMRFKTAYNHQERARSAIADILRSSESFGRSSDEESKLVRAVFESISHCPQWVKSYVSGYRDALREQQRRKLVFCYTVDGKLYSTHRNRDDYYEKHGLGPKEVYEQATFCGHYWEVKSYGGPPELRLCHGGPMKNGRMLDIEEAA
jgi:hypothetical protein